MNILESFITMQTSTAHFAYIDPSVMTYVIQAVAAVVITIGAVAGMHIRKAKKKAMQVLNIEENARKEVEDDIIEIDSDVK